MNFRIYGNRKGQRGGCFFGISMDDNLPVFGGGNLIYAPIYWDKSWKDMDEIQKKLENQYPSCAFRVRRVK